MRTIGSSEIGIILVRRPIKNGSQRLRLNHASRWEEVQRETKLLCMKTWNCETDSSKRIMQEIAKKLEN